MHFKVLLRFLCALLLLWTVSCSRDTQPPGPPNIIYILADDLGYGDIGPYGQRLIETPNLDRLAAAGMVFSQHYAGAPVCAPSRYMLLTGKHAGHAYIRGNDEWASRGPVWDYRAMAADSTLEGQHPLPEGEKLLPQYLREKGYRTGMFGKWGLGAPHTHSVPTKMGFDRFYGYNCQRQAHTYYPLHLYSDLVRDPLDNDTIAPHTGFEDTEEADYAVFRQRDYAPDRIFEALSAFVEEPSEKPFFLYWATPIPHVPLQAPERWVDYYREKFGEEEPYRAGKGFGYFPQASPRAAYAAMVSYLDENIGRLVDQLKAQGLYENTLILFSSDNGPSYAGGADPEWFASAGPFRPGYGRGKGFVYEGGIRVPLIAHWPSRIAAGSRTDHPSAQYDVLPTLAELTGFAVPETADGLSFLPTLLGQPGQQQHQAMVWAFPEYGGQLAIRAGRWKLLQRGLNDSLRNPGPELYDLWEDPSEQQDLSTALPQVRDSLLDLMRREYRQPEAPGFRLREWEAAEAP